MGTLMLFFLSLCVLMSLGSIPDDYEEKRVHVIENEAVIVSCSECVDEVGVKWYNNRTLQEITSREEERIHSHSTDLLFLPAFMNDSAVYICDCVLNMRRYAFIIHFTVHEREPFNSALLYLPVTCRESSNVEIRCPHVDKFKSDNFTWYKDFQLLPNENRKQLFRKNITRKDDGIYTCQLTWTHKGKQFSVSRARRLNVQAPSVTVDPVIEYPRDNTEEALLGSLKNITCKVFIGFNINSECHVMWEVNATSNGQINRYSQHALRREENNKTICMSILTIYKVSPEDFNTPIYCKTNDLEKWTKRFIKLQPMAKDNRLFVTSCFAVLIFSIISVAMLVTYFKIDIVLFYRNTIKPYRDQNDKRYDAYVIYPNENLQESSQEKIRHFIYQDLPNILERKYAYNLFIYGRDVLPGEDTAMVIEEHIINSKRLLIILTPGTSFGMKSENAYDEQLGLYHALVHDEMKVILIEMENFSSYKDLPESLQHIIQKRKTLKWNGDPPWGKYRLRPISSISPP
ncbi:interleukin-1 receptor-like 1 isoform X2 [Polyodon spathula]|uniref:interleukin-1 receptor-like 1 isoform X2 n=1 Tax=Polyodon spathula TaxID=7913 RepID=UPI001B7E02F5|nr:interleukin-1 receptor-like 1 isoform X2 [Polyodon spathula]